MWLVCAAVHDAILQWKEAIWLMWCYIQRKGQNSMLSSGDIHFSVISGHIVYRTLNTCRIHKEMLAYQAEEPGSKHNTSGTYSVASNLGWTTGYFQIFVAFLGFNRQMTRWYVTLGHECFRLLSKTVIDSEPVIRCSLWVMSVPGAARYKAARLLGVRVRIPPVTWMFVVREVCC